MSSELNSELKLHHIAIAVEDLESSKVFFTDLLGLKEIHTESIENQLVQVCLLKPTSLISENCYLELITPLQGNISLSKFLKSKGQGIHHICYEAKNFEKTLRDFSKKGIKIIEGYPNLGSQGKKIAFFHPRDTKGTLIEICSTE